jgi:trehalose utilization protein
MLEASDNSHKNPELLNNLAVVISHLIVHSVTEEAHPALPLYDRFEVDRAIAYMNSHISEKIIIDDLADRVNLSSGHFSKIFKKLMGTTCDLKWREVGEKERIWVVEPGHPIAKGLGEYIDIPQEEMYGERFDIPAPDTLVFLSWFQGGEVFRSGCCYNRGKGRIFYFRPGHETYPVYHQKEIQTVIKNAVRRAAPVDGPKPTFGNVKPLEKL